MSQTLAELQENLAALRGTFSRLGQHLFEVAVQMQEDGIAPPAQLSVDLDGARQSLTTLQEQVHLLAEDHNVSFVLPEALPSLRTLEEAAGEMQRHHEVRRRHAETVRDAAHDVLDRVQRLAHKHQVVFPGLQSCQDQARALLQEILALWPGKTHPNVNTMKGRLLQ